MLKRPIVIATIGYIIGIIVGAKHFAPFCIMKETIMQTVGAFIARPCCVLLFVIFFAVSIYLIRNKKTKRYFNIIFSKKAILIFCIFLSIGIVNVCFLNEKYNKVYKIDREIEVFGVIESVEEQKYNNKYIIKVESINGKKYTNTKLILYAKSNKLEYGDYLKLLAEYEKPEDSRNYKGFSYKNYLKQNMIYGVIKPTSDIYVIEKEKVDFISKVTNSIKSKLISDVNDNLSADAGAIFLGIILGEKSQITDEISTYFREGNMAHILAVSGAHVSYILLTISILLGKFNKKIYLICTIIALSFFMVLTNFSPSVVRACTMAIISLTGKLLHKRSDIYNNLGISALIILLYNPFTIFNIGFQLTYLGTLGIILFNKKVQSIMPSGLKEYHVGVGEQWHIEAVTHIRSNSHNISTTRPYNYICRKFKSFIINLVLISLSVQILIAPIILINFNTLSYNFFISSIIATPIFAVIMVVGIFTLMLGPVKNFCFPILQILLDSLIFISKFISNLPFSKITLPTPSIVWVISYYIIFSVILFSKTRIVLRVVKSKDKITNILKKLIIMLLIICITVTFVQKFSNRDLRIFFIDVAQGDSSLIITPKNKVILIDGGGYSNEDYDVGKNVVVPYLLDRGISSIDYIMVSHFDNDHVGGLMYVIKTLKVKNVLISKQSKESNEYKEFIEIAKERNIRVITVKQGDVIKIENDISFFILYPTTKLEFNDLNNNSIVAKLVYKNFSILFTGDIEKEAENSILQKYNKDTLGSTVLKVAHHGSKTSTTENFINLVNPRIALIGVGKNNNFGHPNEAILSRIEKLGAKICRTDKCGEISIRVNRQGKIWIDNMLN